MDNTSIYRDALLSQGASNLGGLIHGWSRAMAAIQAEAREHNYGTDWVNTHPVNVLFAEQAYHLTGSSLRYYTAQKECEQKAKVAA